MTEKLLNLIMKYPLQFLITGIVLFMVFPFSIWILNYDRAIQMGFGGIIGMGILFGCFVTFLWWLVSWVVLDLFYKGERNNVTHYHEVVKTWHLNVLIGSLIGGCWSLITLGVCYFFSIKFKTYFIIVFVIPILRLMYHFLEKRLFRAKNVRDMFKMDD